MFRQGLTLTLTTAAALTFAVGCAESVSNDPHFTSEDYTEAQFDPTNPIPVLRLIPSPSALAENADHTINQDRVKPAPCELPDQAQCLALVKGWPTTLAPTLYFSKPLDPDTIQDGVIFADAVGKRVAFTAEVTERPHPPAACKEGNNGSTGDLKYTDDEVPPGVQLVLKPKAPLAPNTTYLVAVVSDAKGGLRDAEGRRITAAALYGLLNHDAAPIQEDGTVSSAVLRAQLTGTAMAAAFPGKTAAQLSAQERAGLSAQVKALGQQLYPLAQMFKKIGDGLLAAQAIQSRDQLVISNAWTTANPPTEIMLSPSDQQVPFPNSQLFLKEKDGALRVALPTDGLSGSALGMVKGLNTLDGFSTLAPIFVQASRSLKEDSLDDNILLYKLNAAQDGVDGDPVPLKVTQTSTSSQGPVTLSLQPQVPLAEGTDYVVLFKGGDSGLKDLNDGPVVAPTLYQLLKLQTPLHQAMAADTDDGKKLKLTLQCAIASATGKMLTGDALTGAVQQTFESAAGLNHAAWKPPLVAATTLSAPIQPQDLAMGFSYRTQSIRAVGQQLKSAVGSLTTATSGLLNWGSATAVQAQTVGAVACKLAGLTAGSKDCAPLAAQFALPAGATIQSYTLPRVTITQGSPFDAGTLNPDPNEWAPGTHEVWVVKPSSGSNLPVVILQHGLGANKMMALMIAGQLAKEGFASVMMDLPYHGARASDLVNNDTGAPCPGLDPTKITCKVQGACGHGCDGKQDASGTGFFTANVFGVRGTMRQAIFDQLLLRAQVHALANGDLSLDANNISYVGQSLGAITGANFTAYLEGGELNAAVLNVGGGGLTHILVHSAPEISGPLFAALKAGGICDPKDPADITKGCKQTPAFGRFLQMAQWALDPVDPLNSTMVSSYPQTKQLMQMAKPDPVIPNAATQALWGVSSLKRGGAADPALQTWEGSPLAGNNSCHSFLLSPVCAPKDATPSCLNAAVCQTIGAQQQAIGFLDDPTAPVSGPAQATGLSGIDCANPCN